MKLKITFFLLLQAICFHQIYAQCDGADFEEKNGIAVLELDSKVSGSWRKESISGASGGSALTYRGTDYFNSPGNSTITYKVKINSVGTYRFIWRNKISILAGGGKSTTEHNDSWLKITASNFFGKKGSSVVYPGGSGKFPKAEGSTSNNWFKIYTNTVEWNWTTSTSDFDPHSIYASFNSPGVYNIQVSGRSRGHSIDRMVLYKEGSYSGAQAQSLSRSETDCSDGGTPTTNQAPTVNITSPSNGQTISTGSTVAVRLSANDSDGSISKHEIFVNNSIVDSDGASYSPYEFNNIQPGTYSIRAAVTDNLGKTASSTVSITVDSDGEPDPEPTPPGTNAAPAVSFTNLSDGQVVVSGSNVSVGVSSNDSDGTVVKHQIFVNNALVDTDGLGYTPHIINSISAGNYEIKATVTDNLGKTASSTVSITVDGDGEPDPEPTPPVTNAAPAVSFTNLSDGQVVVSGSNVSVGVSSNDSDGTVVKHQIFVNNALVDTDGSGYTPHIINSISAGNYEIKATVTDNLGETASSTVSITVDGDGEPDPEPTPPGTNAAPAVSFTNLSDGQVVVSGSNVSVGVSSNDSDGTVVKHQIFVNNALVDTDGSGYTPHIINSISEGNYEIKATVTDNLGKTASSTVSITVDGDGEPDPEPTPPGTNAAPAVSFTNLSDGQVVASGSNVSVGVSSNDSDGTVIKHQIFVNNVLVDTDGSDFTPHLIRNISAGNYTIKATVTDDDGKSTSAEINILAGESTPPSSDNVAPIVQFVSLTEGQFIPIGKVVLVGVKANDSDGNVVKHQVYVNSVLVDTDGASYTSHPFQQTKAGDYLIEVVVTDNDGETGSVSVTVTVGANLLSSKQITPTVAAVAFPNPVQTDGNVSIRLPEGSSGEFYYSVSNAIGVQVEQGKFIAQESETDINLELSNVGRQVQGVYYLTLTSRDSKQIIPLIRK